ncbi:hypothetical protein AB7M23_002315 [Pseudomonas sp. HLS-6 TE3448]
MTNAMIIKACVFGFSAGIGFMASQDLWWLATGWVGLCRG